MTSNKLYYEKAIKTSGFDCSKGNISQEFYKYAKERIPGGTQLLSKIPKQYAPGLWPAYYSKAKGCEFGTWIEGITTI